MKKRTRRILYNVLESVISIIIFTLAFFVIVNTTLNIVYEHTPITNYSMQPTLNNSVTSQSEEGDIVFVNKFSTFSSGDIVIAKVKWWPNPVIKRLVGCPGDSIRIREEDEMYSLYCNDTLLYSKAKTDVSLHGAKGRGSNYQYNLYLDFLQNKLMTKDVANNIGTYNDEPCIVLNENEYFLMGDNWGESDDCLIFGPSNKEDIIGKVDFVIPKGENKFGYIIEFIKSIFTTNTNNYKY